MRDWEWLDRAACAGLDPAMFFAAKGDSVAVANARAVCRGCEVAAECLDLAWMEPNRHRSGIYGGLSERERRQLKRWLLGERRGVA